MTNANATVAPSFAPATPKPNHRLAPIKAMKALKRLINDPERTEEVFEILRGLSGNSLWHSYERFRQIPGSGELLERNLLTTLSDRDRLKALPAGTLGHTYYQFIYNENLSADGLVEASEFDEGVEPNPHLLAFGERNRDMHDLWHVTTNYGRDTFGELCLLAFTYAQTRNFGILAIIIIGALKIARERGRGVFGAAWQAYRDGKNAEWLPAADWEALLELPLSDVREQLRVAAPERYRDILNSQSPGLSAA
ncbi:MAG: Coq4 family protein [Pseudomonadaceae bacterium]|nr:Coq4 family protein [Pseudomonadaceae bacterium]